MVVEGERLVGIVSLKDMLRLLALRLDLEGGEKSGALSMHSV
jgi:CBS domain-containing protein